jgi:glycosyltransferase involved in cell wall biosynthesis
MQRQIRKNPIVSVIIPAYNRPQLLVRTIKSVIGQTFKDWELIIVDDGSPNKKVKQVVKDLQKQDKRILYFWQKNSGGPAGPRNVAIKKARGEYIAFLDADDEWLPTKLEKQLKLFKESTNPKLGFVSCNSIIIDERENKIRQSNIPGPERILEHLLSWSCVNSCSGLVVRKEVFKKVGRFDEGLKMADDWDLCIRIAKEYDYDFVKEPLFKYYVGCENINQEWDISNREQEARRVFNKHKSYYEQYPWVYSLYLMHQGKRWTMSGQAIKGIGCFVKSIKLNPFNFQSYFFLILSLFGSKAFNLASRLKRKLKTK